MEMLRQVADLTLAHLPLPVRNIEGRRQTLARGCKTNVFPGGLALSCAPSARSGHSRSIGRFGADKPAQNLRTDMPSP